jgi:hypothetical protein
MKSACPAQNPLSREAGEGWGGGSGWSAANVAPPPYLPRFAGEEFLAWSRSLSDLGMAARLGYLLES